MVDNQFKGMLFDRWVVSWRTGVVVGGSPQLDRWVTDNRFTSPHVHVATAVKPLIGIDQQLVIIITLIAFV